MSALYLHDNKFNNNAIITTRKSDKNTVSKHRVNIIFSRECFLSCSPSIVPFSAYNPDTLQKTSTKSELFSISCKSTITESFPTVRKITYRASGIKNESFFYEKTEYDRFSGPSCNNSKFFLGIDPGVSGAVAVVKDGLIPAFIGVYDMPTYTLKVSGKNRNRIDLTALSFLLEAYANNTRFALIEDVQSMPTDGHVGAFTFGFATGAVHGALAMAGVKIEKIRPAVWKSSMGLDSDKSQSVSRAIKLFPTSEKYLSKKKDHGRAEAILLAWFAWKNARKS